MSSRPKWSLGESGSVPVGLSLLLSEYSHRHAHIWRVVVQATAVVTGLAVIPHLTDPNVEATLVWIPAFGALGLAALAFHRLQREFRLFDSVKQSYLEKTGRWDEKERGGWRHRLVGFKHQVLGFHFLLLVAALVNAVYVVRN